MDISWYKPRHGDHYIRIRGGPHDGLDLSFDVPPDRVVLDLHEYRLTIRSFELEREWPSSETDWNEYEFSADHDQLFYDYLGVKREGAAK